MVNVELLYVRDCPNLSLARHRLNEAVALAGREVVVNEVEIGDEADAAERGMRGSPTILIGGNDVAGANAVPGTVSCRLYAGERGVEGAPSLERLVMALSR